MGLGEGIVELKRAASGLFGAGEGLLRQQGAVIDLAGEDVVAVGYAAIG